MLGFRRIYVLPVINVLGVLPVLPVLRGCKGETGGGKPHELSGTRHDQPTTAPRPERTTPKRNQPKPPRRPRKRQHLKAGQPEPAGRGLSGRVGDVAAQGRSVAKALPHHWPDRTAVGPLTKQTTSKEHRCRGRLATGWFCPGRGARAGKAVERRRFCHRAGRR